MHTMRKHREEETPNAIWNYPVTFQEFTVQSVTGTGSITFTGGNGGALGANASFSPPQGAVPNSGGKTLGDPPTVPGELNVTDVTWDGIDLSFTYNGFTYTSGRPQPGGNTLVGTIELPSPTVVQKNWNANHQ